MFSSLGSIIGSGSAMTKGWAGAVAERKAASALQKGNVEAEAAALEGEDKAYGLEKEKLAPWEQFGDKARMSFQDLLGYNGPDAQAAAMESLRSSPAFQFRLKTDRDMIEGGAAGKGNLYSGRTAMALQDRGQQLASTEYDKEYQRRAGLGQAAYGITTDAMNRGGNYYRKRGDIKSGTRLRAGEIAAGKWKGYGRVQADANDSAAAAWSGGGGSGSGGGMSSGGGGNPYENLQTTGGSAMNWGGNSYYR